MPLMTPLIDNKDSKKDIVPMFWWRIIPLKLKRKIDKEVCKAQKGFGDTFD